MAELTEKPVEIAKVTAEAEKDEEPKIVKEDIKAEEEDVGKSGDEEEAAANSENCDEDASQLERKIIRQVEYYFGDANLNRDKFLLEHISKNDDGWVPLTVLLTFKRLAALTEKAEVIAEALLKSDEGLVEVSDDKEKVRRHPERPIPEHNEERRKEIVTRTAYCKGFPLDINMSELIDFFAPYVKVLNINMRKYLDKPTKTYKFKGSVFVTFEKKEQTQDFVEKEKVMFKERELLRIWQEKYLEEKREEQKKKAKKSKAKQEKEEDKIKLPKGAVLFFDGATESVTRELLREAVETSDGSWEIAYIDYSKGDKNGHIRFQEENIAAKFLQTLEDQKLKLKGDIELTARSLTEEEEKAFLDKAIEHMKNRRNNQKHKGHGHGHGHGQRKRRAGGSDNHDEKKKKGESAE